MKGCNGQLCMYVCIRYAQGTSEESVVGLQILLWYAKFYLRVTTFTDFLQVLGLMLLSSRCNIIVIMRILLWTIERIFAYKLAENFLILYVYLTISLTFKKRSNKVCCLSLFLSRNFFNSVSVSEWLYLMNLFYLIFFY